jgi:hypothetical protein
MQNNTPNLYIGRSLVKSVKLLYLFFAVLYKWLPWREHHEFNISLNPYARKGRQFGKSKLWCI